MRIALFPNAQKADAWELAMRAAQILMHAGVSVCLERERHSILGAEILEEISPNEIDFRLTFGGDGTILRVFHRHPTITAPILGINLGSLGFLAGVPATEVEESLVDLMNGNYQIEHRMTLEGSVGDHSFWAVNECVIHRAHNPCLVDLEVYVDESYVNTFCADGVILATPTGSTAYSLAAGGPIISPDLDAMIIAPICPHTISNRPIVFLPKVGVTIQASTKLASSLEITYDGMPGIPWDGTAPLLMYQSDRRFQLVRLKRFKDYFSTLRHKLGWQGRLRMPLNSTFSPES